jgi:hypothetical protein
VRLKARGRLAEPKRARDRPILVCGVLQSMIRSVSVQNVSTAWFGKTCSCSSGLACKTKQRQGQAHTGVRCPASLRRFAGIQSWTRFGLGVYQRGCPASVRMGATTSCFMVYCAANSCTLPTYPCTFAVIAPLPSSTLVGHARSSLSYHQQCTLPHPLACLRTNYAQNAHNIPSFGQLT